LATTQNAYLDFLTRYGSSAGEDGPVLFAQEVIGADLDPWQEDVLRAYGRAERRISIRACHGPGKTFIAAIAVWHQMLTRYPQKTVATAPSRGQLEDALFAEIISMYQKLPTLLQELFEVKQNRIELKSAPKDSFFSARTARAESPEALQGVHSEHVLLIADEASGVPEQIFEAAAGSMSGHAATTLLLGNPVRSSGFFFDTHHKLRDMWFTVHVGARDSSRVSDDFVLDIARRYGEESNAYRIRVLGEFPLADDDTVIPYGLVEGARNRDIVLRSNLREVWGVDIARGGSDRSSIVRRNGMAVLPDIEVWTGNDLMQSASRIKAKWDGIQPGERPEWILIDVIGLGAGVVDRCRELGLPVRGINVSESASLTERYANLRAELWFRGRDWLESKDHVLPRCAGGCAKDCPHEVLASELVGPKYGYTSSGKILVESKADMKKRGLRSPDIADAFLLSLAVDVSGMIHGTRGSNAYGSNWSEPVRRNRATV
jgi:phage terminase large subunit